MSSEGYWRGLKLEKVGACPLCGAGQGEVEYRFPPFSLVRCDGCSVTYLSPRVREDDMKGIYENPSYFSSDSSLGYADYGSQSRGLRRSFRLLLRRLRRLGGIGGALLEVGCGPGLFLSESRPFFSLQVGMDFSSYALEKASRHADKVIYGGVEALDGSDRFDVVVAISLIEHVYGPVGFLRRLVGHVKEGGRILFVTPEVDGVWYRVLGRRWPSFKVPEHVVLYNRRSLRILGELCGLRSSFFPFTQFAPLSLVFDSLGLVDLLPGVVGNVHLPIPFTMLGVIYEVE